jgi:short-subunit dehydrogenase
MTAASNTVSRPQSSTASSGAGLTGGVISIAQHYRARRAGIGTRDASTEGAGRTALVTGASAGIGRAMVELLAAKGYDVVVIARREQHLLRLQGTIEARWGVTVLPIVTDLGTRTAPGEIVDTLNSKAIPVDVLVNNAGYVDIGAFESIPWTRHDRFLQTIALTPIELCHSLLPAMLERGWGRIINVASVSALFAGSPSMTLYSGAKSLLLKFTEGLAAECAPRGVHCTVSIPGVTASEFFESNRMSGHFAGHLPAQLTAMRPESVARGAYRASMSGRRLIVHGWHHKVAMFLCVHSPAAVRYAMARNINELTLDPL